jgi:CRISPR-associated protein Cas1
VTVLYVKEQGAVVQRDVEQIRVVRKADKPRKQALLSASSVHELEQVVLFGNVQLTTQAAALLLQNDIDVVFLSQYGSYRGRLSKDGSKFARLRHAQLALTGDESRAITVAYSIVEAKLANQRNLMQRLRENSPTALAGRLDAAADGIDRMRRECRRATTLDALRGFEGKAGAYYFGALKTVLDPKWGFDGRAYYPPPDPFNALLSFGYSLLLKDVTTTIQLVGLDPYLGCFHALEYGRPSLTLDLMEEFRPLVVDEPMLALALSGGLTPDQFTFTGRQERPVELGPERAAVAIQAYEKRMDETVTHTASGLQNRLRRCLELQARIYAGVVMGNRTDYAGLVA